MALRHRPRTTPLDARSVVLREPGLPSVVNPRERELLTGMGNCFEACHADFEETIEMVANNRGRTTEDVKQTLHRMRGEYGTDSEYQRLRRRIPAEFPI
jgi:hypothetical protein